MYALKKDSWYSDLKNEPKEISVKQSKRSASREGIFLSLHILKTRTPGRTNKRISVKNRVGDK